MTLRRDGDGDDGDGDDGDGGDDQPDEETTDPEFMADISPERQLLDKQPGGGRGLRHLLLSWRFLDHWKLVASWKGGGRRQKLLQAHLGTYFSQPVQHGSGHNSSGLLGTCWCCRNVSSSWA